MKKWILRIALGLFTSLLLIIGTIFFLLGTQSGADFIIAQTEKYLDGRLQIASASGNILDHLELKDILFDSPTARVNLGKLVLDWKSSDICSLNFHIVELRAEDISYTVIPQPPESETTKAEPISLPNLNLPVRIAIDKLTVNNLTFYANPDAEPLVVNHSSLALFWDKKGIQLQEFSFAMPEVDLLAKGQVLPTGNYPLTLTTDIQTPAPNTPSVTLHGEYSGNLQKLSMTQELRGDMEADIHATLQDILHAPAWDIDIHITELVPKTFIPAAPQNLSGTIQSTGNLQQLAATAQLHVRDDKEAYLNWDTVLDVDLNLESLLIKIKQCTFKHPDTAAIIELAGTADMEQQLDLALKWQQLQWPVTGTAEYRSATGNVSLTGTVDDFHLLGETILSGKAIPETAVQLKTDGNKEGVRDMQLTLNTLEGQLLVHGNAEWTPAVTWQVQTEAKNLNPGAYFSQWPGQVNWLLQSDGHFEESGIFANVIIERLQGSLRNYPITGTGKINIAADTIQIDNLLLSSGDATMRAEGVLGEASELKWNIQIPDFDDLLPDSSGEFNGSGTILGKLTTPKLELQVAGKSIVFPQAELLQLQLDADVDLSWEEAFRVNLVAMDLHSGENEIQKVTLQAEGVLTKHTINLFAGHELADLSLDLAGGYVAEQWHGAVEKLLIDSEDMGKWQNRTPAKITAGTQSATLEPLCLNRETSDLCMYGNWDKDNTTSEGNVSLTGFPLSWLSNWFPENLDNLGGTFSFEAKATMQDKLQATAQARITPGKIIYNTEKKQGSLAHEGLKLDLLIGDDGMDADLWCSVDSNIVSGKLSSPDLLQTEEKHSPAINGKININANNFQLVEKLVPDVQNIQAQINTDFSIQGTLAQPNVHGNGKIQINTILIPIVGLELSDTSLDILADNSTLKINGTLHSTKGSMAIDGLAHLDAKQNYPARVTLKGTNFRLVNLPDIQVYLSSDLLIDKQLELTTLSGTVIIPAAEILLRELPKGATTASPDIVILQEKTKPEPKKAPMRMNVKIGLGKEVHFVGFGLNAFIDGQLNITAEPKEQMLGSGEFYIKQGNYRAYGQDLDIETGVISFPGGPLTQPGINLRATRTAGNIVAGISAIGPAAKPRITTFSRPPMSESLTLSYLLTGSAPNAGGGNKLSIERQINSNLNVSVGTDIKSGESEFVTRYRLSRKIFLQTTTGNSSNAADIFYTTEFGGEEKKEEE